MDAITQFMDGGVVWASLELLKATVLLLAVFGIASSLRRASAGARHLVWGAGLVALLALPFASAISPWRLSLPEVRTQVTIAPPQTAAPRNDVAAPVDVAVESQLAAPPVLTDRTHEAGEWTMQRTLLLLLVVWTVGVTGVLLRILGGGFAVHRLLRRAQPVDSQDWRGPLFEAADRLELKDAPRLLMSSDLPMPFVAGVLRPSIVLPAAAAEWTQDRRRAVLLHELAHVRRADLALNLIVRIVCALYWFHPLVHVAARRLRAESERACDDLVLHVGTRASTYADHLLDIVRGAGRSRTPAVALPMAQRREFEGRMLAILEADARREPPRRRHAALAALAALLIVLPLAAMTPGMTSATPPVEPPQSPSVASALPSEPEPVDEKAAASPAPALPKPDRTRKTDQRQDTSVITALRAALRDANAEVRGEAVWALGSLNAKEAASELAQIARSDASAEVREMAVWSLVTIGDRAAALSALGEAARTDEDAEVRATAVWGLGTFDAETEQPALVAALADADAEVRSRAAWALGTIRPKTAPEALIRALEDDNADVRETSAWALGQIGDPASIGALTRRVADPEAGEAVLWAIGNIGGEAARPALLEALRTGNDDVRAAAARALAGRAGNNPWPWPWPMPRPRG